MRPASKVFPYSLALASCLSTVHAATIHWDGEDAIPLWHVDNNWNTDQRPQSGLIQSGSTQPPGASAAHNNLELRETFIIGDGARMDAAPDAKGVLRIGTEGT